MDGNKEGVITIVVSNNQMRLALVNDVGANVDVIIAADNPRWEAMMDLIGDQLRKGPIVCEGEAEVVRLIDCIKNGVPVSEELLKPQSDVPERHVFEGLRVYLHDVRSLEPAYALRDVTSPKFHREVNQALSRFRPEGRKQKHTRPQLLGKKR